MLYSSYRKKHLFKYAVVAVVLSVVYTTFMVNKEFIGRARYESFVEEFIYKAHSISKINSVKYITLWVHDGKDDLLIRFPHTDDKQKQLEKAQKRSQKGIIQKGKMTRKNNKLFNDTETELMLYDFPFQEQFPKN